MRKVLVCIVLIIVLVCSLFCACTTKGDSDNSKDVVEYYLSDAVDDGSNYSITNVSAGCSGGGSSVYLTATVTIKNNTTTTQTYSVSSASVVREKTEAKYATTINFKESSDSITLDSDLTSNINLRATLPSSTSNEDYYLLLTIEKTNYKFFLYKKAVSVSLVVDGTTYSKTARSNTQIDDLEWISSDYTKYCKKWYREATYTDECSKYNQISSGAKYYGQSESIFSYSYTDPNSSIKIAFITGYTYVPSNNVLIYPSEIGGDKVYSIKLGAYNTLKSPSKIFLRKNITIGASSDFGSSKVVIYYEGTREEWSSKYSGSELSENVTFVYNATISDVLE